VEILELDESQGAKNDPEEKEYNEYARNNSERKRERERGES
jgi:hypothetical protein